MKFLSLSSVILLLFSCQFSKTEVDAIYYNGNINTLNDSLPTATCMIIKNKKIIDIGSDELLNKYKVKNNKTDLFDLKKQTVYPGFIDAHCHFYGYAKTSLSCQLTGTKSWEEIINKLDSFSEQTSSAWLTGRGWDQNDWSIKKYPTNDKLNQKFPDRPVILKRVDGHAAICNQKALTLAGIDANTKIQGGEILLDKGKLTGVLIDNAVDLVEKIVIKPSQNDVIKALQNTEKECFSKGLTTLADAGLDLNECLFIDSLGKINSLSIYTYLMLNPNDASFQFAKNKGILENDNTKICSFKLYGDGSLGSRGAKLKQDYCDQKNHNGLMIYSQDFYLKTCQWIKNNTKYQVNTHCIGDSANRFILDVYSQCLTKNNDERWRIEHAQVVDPKDMVLFQQYNVIPSVQPTHATSDGPWAEERLCKHRLNGAYAYKSLLKTNQYLPLGTDFPVEYIDPLYTYYSAVYRQSATSPMDSPFLINESLSPIEAIKGMTIWAAKACKLEHRKGSLAKGMDADFIVLNQDLLSCKQEQVLNTKIVMTVSSGKLVFKI